MTLSDANSPISSTLDLITPAWSCPANVVAYTTTRMGGTSIGDFAGLNVGAHVGDDLLLVKANRSLIPHSEKITWLEQVPATARCHCRAQIPPLMRRILLQHRIFVR